MNISTLLAEKKEKNKQLKTKYSLLQKYKSIWLICINDSAISEELAGALQFLPGAFIVHMDGVETNKVWNVVITSDLDKALLAGFDFVVGCDEIEGLHDYIKQWVSPIVSSHNHLATLLSEFNPIKNKGNAFIYSELNTYAIFAAITRYLENYKFSMDNKNLIRNVLAI